MAPKDGTGRAQAARTGEPIVAVLHDGRRIAARFWPGDGPPLVLLHGLLDSCEGWDSLCRSTRRPCLAVDLPGFGCSDGAARPRISAFAEAVVELLERLDVRGCRLVGHSLGGGVATGVAERAAERVASLVLLAPTGFGRIPVAEAVSLPGVRDVTRLLLPLGLRSRAGLQLVYMAMIANGEPPEPELLERVVDQSGRLVPGARAAVMAIAAAGVSERAFHRRRVGYGGPVTVVWGERDRLVPPAHMSGVRFALPQAECELWPGMGHHPQRERPAALLALLDGASAEPAPVARAA